jgi:hypothetical protein
MISARLDSTMIRSRLSMASATPLDITSQTPCWWTRLYASFSKLTQTNKPYL